MSVLPTPRLLGLLLLAAVPLALGSLTHVFLVVTIVYLLALAGLVIVDIRLGPAHDDLDVSRHHETRLTLGEPNEVNAIIRWTSAKYGDGSDRMLQVRDETPPEIPGEQPIMTGAITPGGEWRGTYNLTPVRRGTYQFGDLWLRVETPFKLALRQFAYERKEPARVYPNLRAIRQYDLLARRGRLAEVGVHRTRYLGRGSEFERLRDYQPDDEYRRINWKATARRHVPVTVDYETERSQTLLLMLDTGRLMGAPVGDLDKLDHALNSALLLGYVASKAGDRVGTVAFADDVRAFVPPGRGDRQFHLLLDALHDLRVQPVESDLRRTVAFLASRHQRRSLVIYFTDLAAEIDAYQRRRQSRVARTASSGRLRELVRPGLDRDESAVPRGFATSIREGRRAAPAGRASSHGRTTGAARHLDDRGIAREPLSGGDQPLSRRQGTVAAVIGRIWDVVFSGDVDLLTGITSRQEQIAIEQDQGEQADAKLGRLWDPAWRDETLERSSEHEQRHAPEQERNGSRGGVGQRGAARDQPRAEQGVSQSQTAAAGDEDDGHLDTPVWRHEADQGPAEPMSDRQAGRRAEQQPVFDQHQDRGEPEEDTATKGQDRDTDVIGHNKRGFQTSIATCDLHPALTLFDLVDQLTRRQDDPADRRIGKRQAERQGKGDQQEGKGRECVCASFPERPWETVHDKERDRTPLARLTMIDQRVHPADQLLEVVPHPVVREIAPRNRQVRGDLPVEATQPFDIIRTQIGLTTPARSLQQRFQFLPTVAPLIDEDARI